MLSDEGCFCADEDEPGPCGDDKAEAVREDEAAPSGAQHSNPMCT